MRTARAWIRARSRRIDKLLYMIALQLQTGPGPVAVYSLGKSASTTIERTIEEEIGRPVIHCHRVTRAGIRDAAHHRRAMGSDRRPYEDWRGEYLRHRLRLRPRQRWDIVCAVRDPVAREVSATFQTGLELGYFDESELADAGLSERLTGRVVDRLGRNPMGWFTDELEAVTGIDVYAVPFDRSAGWQTYSHGRFRALVVRFEDLGRVGSDALGSFLGGPPPVLSEENVSRGKVYADLLERFLAEATFPEPVLDSAYGSRLAQHFYTPEERARFRARWAG